MKKLLLCMLAIMSCTQVTAMDQAARENEAATRIQKAWREYFGEELREKFIKYLEEGNYECKKSMSLCAKNYWLKNLKNFSVCIKQNPSLARDDKRLHVRKSLLNHAVMKDDEEAINCLLDGGVHPDALDGDFKQSPLHVAAIHNTIKAAAILFARGANPNLQDDKGRTPMHCAATHGLSDMIRLLHDHGASIDAITKSKPYLTPLHFAIDEPCVVRVLIELGVKLNQKNWRGETPLEYGLGCMLQRNISEKYSRDQIKKLYDEKNYTDMTPLQLKRGNEYKMRSYIDEIKNRERMKDYKESIALLIAARADMSHLTEDACLLLSAIKEPVDAIDKNSETTLHDFIIHPWKMQELADLQARLNEINSRGETPLQFGLKVVRDYPYNWFEFEEKLCHREFIELLIGAGADTSNLMEDENSLLSEIMSPVVLDQKDDTEDESSLLSEIMLSVVLDQKDDIYS